MTDLVDRLNVALADRYTLQRELGRGGMATVYLATDLRHDRPVALKVLKPELAQALGADRFLREIKTTAQLTHPHILPLLDSGDTDGFLYYVMPYVEGESLRDRLDHEKQLPVDDALQISREVADALSYAHSHGVIHRDIKPENILLEAGHAVVADFGIARAVDQAGGEKLTETGIAVGTPTYMSPEQAGGSRDIDGRSDLYSLGCVLYEMLAGQPPFTGPTVESLVHQHLAVEPPNITAIRPSVPGWVVAALERSLAKTPADRFNPVAQFGEAISPRGGMMPTDTRPHVTVATRGRKRWIGVAAAAVVIAVTGTAILLPRWGGKALDAQRVLVVALAGESGSEESRALGLMAQDYIIQTLSEAGFAEVIDPLTAVAVTQNVAAAGVGGAAGSILTLADQAGAGTVVSGTYYAEGDSVHIQIRITDARDGRMLGTVGPIAGTVGARRELVARLGREVVAALAPLLDRDLGDWEPGVQPAAYEAYEAYYAGLEAYLRNEAAEAARQFDRAAAVDPKFARARLWAAQSYSIMGNWGGRWFDPASLVKADSLIAPLLESRGQLSRYERCRLDFVVALGQMDFSTAYDAARCMVRAAPGSEDARRELAISATRLNRPGEAIEILRELDPDRGLMKQWSSYWGWLCMAYHMRGDYEGELQAVREGRQRYPGDRNLLSVEGQALAALGRLNDVAANLEALRSLAAREPLGQYLGEVAIALRTHGHRDAAREVFDESIAWYQSQLDDTEESRAALARWLYEAERWSDARRLFGELAAEYPDSTTYLAALGRLAARRGDREAALRVSEELQSLEDPRDRYAFDRAKIAALLGDREQAMTLLEQANDMGVNWGVLHWLHRDIDFEPLHDYPPFQELMRPKG